MDDRKETRMKAKILTWLLGQLIGFLNPDLLKGLADRVIDYIEDAIADSETDLDDKFAGPIIKMIRTSFDIPDND